MLEGENVNLRIMEKEDLPLLNEWTNNTEFLGEYFSPNQTSMTEREKAFSEPSPFEMKRFIRRRMEPAHCVLDKVSSPPKPKTHNILALAQLIN